MNYQDLSIESITPSKVVYLTFDNMLPLILKSNGTALDLSGVDKVSLTIDDVEYASDDGGDAVFHWKSGQDGDSTKVLRDGLVLIGLGQCDLEEGAHEAKLVIYPSDKPNGIRLPVFWVEVT